MCQNRGIPKNGSAPLALQADHKKGILQKHVLLLYGSIFSWEDWNGTGEPAFPLAACSKMVAASKTSVSLSFGMVVIWQGELEILSSGSLPIALQQAEMSPLALPASFLFFVICSMH